ncbi:hypothetical protein BH24ACT12_BH24ACT12_18390 [soil metagenome]
MIHLRGGEVSVVLDTRRTGLPVVLHWGADLGAEPIGLLASTEPVTAHSALDEARPAGLLPEYAHGFAGRPGLTVARAGDSSWSSRLVTVSTATDGRDAVVVAADDDLGLTVRTELHLEPGGLLRMRHTVTNTGSDELDVRELLTALPVPEVATELLDLSGRWCRERSPQRRPLHQGAVVRESRRGRTGHDASPLMVTGTEGFGFGHGELWAVHVAWSGDHVTYAERLSEGHTLLGGGELLGQREVVLAAQESYSSPWLLASWSADGLDTASARLHHWLRARATHPTRPRTVLVNTWAAVYFDHDLQALTELAGLAAEVGAERFVFDDGWFRGRRDDHRGLGDWTVDEEVWPEGLHPLVDHVRSLGMDFGLWVEPEMVNVDSDVVRGHPAWVLRGRETLPQPWRRQQVLDLANPSAYAHVRDALLALLREYDIAYLKWDHNRDLVDAGHGGRPAVHGQTLAVYRQLDELRAAHRAWRSRAVPPAVPASTPRSCSAPTGSGPATETTRWSGRRSSAGPRCWCPRSSWAATSPRPPRTRPGAPTRWTSGPPRRCSGTSASSGTCRR